MSSGKYGPFYLGLNVLTHLIVQTQYIRIIHQITAHFRRLLFFNQSCMLGRVALNNAIFLAYKTRSLQHKTDSLAHVEVARLPVAIMLLVNYGPI